MAYLSGKLYIKPNPIQNVAPKLLERGAFASVVGGEKVAKK